MKKFRYICEVILVAPILMLFSVLPSSIASAAGGFIAKSIGPRLATSRRALRHLRLALPGKNDQEYQAIVAGMWNNLGRVFAEYPHLENLAKKKTELVGFENFYHSRQPAILISGHLANWEIAATSFFVQGTKMDLIYRAPNNPWVEKILKKMRSLDGKIITHAKSSRGMRHVVDALKSKRNLGILIDQKYNQGIEALFFGRPAMTSPAFIQLARKYECPVYPVRVERIRGCNFRVTLFPPLDMSLSDNDLIIQAHSLLESWINDRPDQWIWLHRRWRDSGKHLEKLD